MILPKVGMRIRLLPDKKSLLSSFLNHFPSGEATVIEIKQPENGPDAIVQLLCPIITADRHNCAWYWGTTRGEPYFEILDDSMLEELLPDPFFVKTP